MRKFLVAATVLWLCLPAISRGQAYNAADDAADRLNRLETETQALREEVKRLREDPVRLPAVDATQTGMPAPDATPVGMAAPNAVVSEGGQGDYFTMDELRAEMKKNAWKKGDFSIVPYGIIWGNTVYSTQRTSPGSYTLFVQSPTIDNEGEFLVDARNSRVGFDLAGPPIPLFDCTPVTGKVEVDFQNSVLSTENKATILLRHAYVETKNEDYRLVCGQTWDIISPLNPATVLYSVGWYAGNIGYRRAQFRGERYLAFSDTSLVTVQASFNQQVFEDSANDYRGQPSNWPVLEGRVAWTVGERGKDCQPITVGMSGHIGEEEFDSTVIGLDNRRRTWSGNLDIRIPITEKFGVQGECFTGENLGAFLGNIGQGIDPISRNTIRGSGGWFEVWYDWCPTVHSHIGYAVDDPNDHDLFAVTSKTYNQFYFANIFYDLTKNCLVGFEVSSWKTLYVDELPGDSIRSEFALKYSF